MVVVLSVRASLRTLNPRIALAKAPSLYARVAELTAAQRVTARHHRLEDRILVQAIALS